MSRVGSTINCTSTALCDVRWESEIADWRQVWQQHSHVSTHVSSTHPFRSSIVQQHENKRYQPNSSRTEFGSHDRIWHINVYSNIDSHSLMIMDMAQSQTSATLTLQCLKGAQLVDRETTVHAFQSHYSSIQLKTPMLMPWLSNVLSRFITQQPPFIDYWN